MTMSQTQRTQTERRGRRVEFSLGTLRSSAFSAFGSFSRLALVAGVLLVAACDEAPVRPLTVVGWGGSSQAAHRQAYWTSFTERTGVQLKEDTWSGGIGVLRAKVRGGADPGWDVIQVETEELILGCEEGVFEKLDWNALGGRDAFLPQTVQDCGVGAMVWSYLIGYDRDRLQTAPQRWADFWDLQRIPGKRGFRKTPKYTLEIALLADGVAPADVYRLLATEEGVNRAFRKLDEIKSSIVWWVSISQVPDLLASGEVAMSVTSPGRLLVANKTENKHFGVVWTGNIQAVDWWAVLKGGPRKGAATQLVQYMTRPENQSRLPDFIPTGVSNREALAKVDAAHLAETPLDPNNMHEALQLDAQFWVEHADQLTQRFNAWLARGS
jgi:putative spermidine/putrescine transport system substrate-binding protein